MLIQKLMGCFNLIKIGFSFPINKVHLIGQCHCVIQLVEIHGTMVAAFEQVIMKGQHNCRWQWPMGKLTCNFNSFHCHLFQKNSTV